MFRRYVILFLLFSVGIALQACGRNPTPQESCGFLQNGELQRVSWGSRVPVTIYVHESVPDKHLPAIQAAAEVWNREVGRQVLRITSGLKGPLSPSPDGSNVIYFMNTWEADKLHEQARTTVNYLGNRIYDADVVVNEFKYDFSSDELHPNRVDLESLMIHEFGHVLGLQHVQDPQSVMVEVLNSGTARRKLSEKDQSLVRCEY